MEHTPPHTTNIDAAATTTTTSNSTTTTTTTSSSSAPRHGTAAGGKPRQLSEQRLKLLRDEWDKACSQAKSKGEDRVEMNADAELNFMEDTKAKKHPIPALIKTNVISTDPEDIALTVRWLASRGGEVSQVLVEIIDSLVRISAIVDACFRLIVDGKTGRRGHAGEARKNWVDFTMNRPRSV